MLDVDASGRMLRRDAPSCAATDPGITQAVATLTAPNTPMASCTRCGMNVRVAIAPPWRGATDQAHLRHGLARHIAEIHARAHLQPDAFDCAFSAALASSCSGVSSPVTPSPPRAG